MRLLLFFILFWIGGFAQVLGQGTILTHLNSRHTENKKESIHNKSVIILDTLLLPFFEDFTATAGYPSEMMWLDRCVWVNNNMAKNPPNYNVATFDHLNLKGQPYTTLNPNEMVYADSLTSFPLKLDSYKTGPSSTASYLPGDSIMLSFFYQLQGFGDLPEAEDSLVLFFKTKNLKWNRVWSVSGGTAGDFIQAVVPVNEFDYLHNAFQFRFVNYTKSTGNLNHWNLDYIRVEKYKNRSGGNDISDISDIGIVNPDYRLFNPYYSMPISHFKTNPGALLKNQLSLTVRNLNTASNKTTQTRFGLKVHNSFNTLVFNQPLSASSRNILFNSDSTLPYSKLTLDTFSGKNPKFSITYIIEPQSNDETPDAYNSAGNNNELRVEHQFTPWYAYDDGSAEGGFGLDYAFLGNVKGQFALKFDNLKNDSLRGVAMYFNRSESDVAFRSFYVRVWKSISDLGKPDNSDVLVYEQFVERPAYTDSINHFSYIFFDSVLNLSQGTFYMGWRQNAPFILNVGYDNNYRYNEQNIGNPNLFHNLLGSWERSDFDIKGVPMIRPLLGAEKDYSFQVKPILKNDFKVYPNPSHGLIHWQSNIMQGQIRILDVSGREVLNRNFSQNEMEISHLNSGTYFVLITGKNGETFRSKIIKE